LDRFLKEEGMDAYSNQTRKVGIIVLLGISLWGCAYLPYKVEIIRTTSERPRVETYMPRSTARTDVSPAETGNKTTFAGVKERKPLTVEACVQIALDKNPIIRAAREGVSAAKEAAGEAKAPYYPEISMSAGYSRWERHAFLPKGLTQPDVPSTIGPTDDWIAGLKARYLLFDSGERQAKLRAAISGREVLEEDASRVRQNVALDVHQSYYSFISALEARSVAEKNLARAEDHLRLAKERKAAGAVPQADVVRAQTRVADEKLNLVRAENLVRITKGNLNTAMGLPVEMPVEVETQPQEMKPPDNIDLGKALDQAVRGRSEIKAALHRVEKARSEVDGAKSAFGPKLMAEAGYGRRDEDFFPHDKDWLVGITIDLPLFTGFSRTHRLGRTKAELKKEEAQVTQVIQEVRQEVWSAHSRLKEAYQAVQAAEVLVKDAQESARLTQERYRVGAGTITDLLDSQTTLARANATRVEREWNYHIAKAAFRRAIGDLVAQE
jgi:TolC family type I secretion outer membrane protein